MNVLNLWLYYRYHTSLSHLSYKTTPSHKVNGKDTRICTLYEPINFFNKKIISLTANLYKNRNEAVIDTNSKIL